MAKFNFFFVPKIQDSDDIEDSVKNVIELNNDFENTNKIEQALGTIHN